MDPLVLIVNLNVVIIFAQLILSHQGEEEHTHNRGKYLPNCIISSYLEMPDLLLLLFSLITRFALK